MKKTKQLPVETARKSPIQYSFGYRLNVGEDGNYTGFFDVIITAECQGVRLFELRQPAFSGTLAPKLKEKMDIVKATCQEDAGLYQNGFAYSNCDCLFKLILGQEDIEKYKEVLSLAIDDLKQEMAMDVQRKNIALIEA